MMERAITVRVPVAAFDRIRHVARQQRRSVPDMVRDLIVQDLPGLPPLPLDVESELGAFASLSDTVLWLIARSTLTKTQQSELAQLNHKAQQRSLTERERIRQQKLGDAYDRVLVRRAQAAALLKSRGYDLSNLSVLEAT